VQSNIGWLYSERLRKTVITFPTCIMHIFYGYRGTGVLNDLNFTGYLGRIQFFTSMLNEYTCGNMLLFQMVMLLMLAIIWLAIAVWWKKPCDGEVKKEIYWYISGLSCCTIACLILMKVSFRFCMKRGRNAQKK